MSRPDARMLAAARMVENLAAKLPAVRLHLAGEIARIDGIGSTMPGASGSAGGGHSERTISVPVECPGYRPCLWDKCPDGTEPHSHPCPIEGEHTHPDRVPITSVEDYALRRLALVNEWEDLLAHATAIATIAANLSAECDRVLGVRVEVPLCEGGKGRDGFDEWGKAGCGKVASRGGDPANGVAPVLCDSCSRREYRWRKRVGLPTRSDGVFAMPARTDPAA